MNDAWTPRPRGAGSISQPETLAEQRTFSNPSHRRSSANDIKSKRTRSTARSVIAGLMACAATLAVPRGYAAEFDAQGTFLFEDDAIVRQGFEPDENPGLSGGTHSVEEDPGALQGTHVLRVAAHYQSVDLALQFPQSPGVYRASAWVKGYSVVGLAVAYGDGTGGTYVQLFPTGRMTSDGWVEIASAPFSADGSRKTVAAMFFFGDCDVDGVEIVPDQSKKYTAPTQCNGVTDPRCEDGMLCLGGWCRDPSGWVPPLPPESGRKAMIEYLRNRIRFFFAPYRNRRQKMGWALRKMEAMQDARTPWQFWNGFATAIRMLSDSHTTAASLSQWVVTNRRPLNACFMLGKADLESSSSNQEPAILVSRADSKYGWGLHPGDRLVAIDHVDPLTWARSLVDVDWNYASVNDPRSWSYMVETLRLSIPRFADTITVVHCDQSGCGPEQVLHVNQMPTLPQGQRINPLMCDNRIKKLVAGQPSSHDMGMSAYTGPVVGTSEDEKIYGLVFDALISGSPGASAINKAAKTWEQSARGVIIDHRLGNGGMGPAASTGAAEPIVQFMRSRELIGIPVWRVSADEEGPQDIAEGLDLVDKYRNTNMAWYAGSDHPKTDVPVALLLTRDVSFSDLFALASKGSPHTRIFAPQPTNGAFSSFLGLSYHFGISVRYAFGDLVDAQGATRCGRGVEPDEVVWPLQSDLVAGRDTLIDRALQWVRSEMKR